MWRGARLLVTSLRYHLQQARMEVLTGREDLLAMAATTTAAFGTIAPPSLESSDAICLRPKSNIAFWRYLSKGLRVTVARMGITFERSSRRTGAAMQLTIAEAQSPEGLRVSDFATDTSTIASVPDLADVGSAAR